MSAERVHDIHVVVEVRAGWSDVAQLDFGADVAEEPADPHDPSIEEIIERLVCSFEERAGCASFELDPGHVDQDLFSEFCAMKEVAE